MAEDKKDRIVLVTGFGPFQGHPINASWEAVKKLQASDLESELNVTLIVKEIPVVYESVSTLVPQLWSEYNPMLTIHVGVSHKAKCLTIESQAHETGYERLDVEKKYPCKIRTDDNDIGEPVKTGIDIESICNDLNSNCVRENDDNCKAVISEDAGRYICEYTYHKSLAIKPRNTIFVHVPDFRVYTVDKTADGLKYVIRSALKQISDCDINGKKD